MGIINRPRDVFFFLPSESNKAVKKRVRNVRKYSNRAVDVNWSIAEVPLLFDRLENKSTCKLVPNQSR